MTRIAGILLTLCLMFVSGCASKTPIVVPTKTITLDKEVIVPVPESLTRQVDIPQVPKDLDTLGLGLLYKQTVTRLMIANGRLKEIENLGRQ